MALSLNQLIQLNNTLITEHGRVFSDSYSFSNVDIELASGNVRRFTKPPRLTFSFSWNYCPDKQTMTVDGKVGRDFIYNTAFTNDQIFLSIQSDRNNEWKYYNCMLSDYSESLIRHEMATQTKYYNISMSLSEI
jgi:hypothetical protein